MSHSEVQTNTDSRAAWRARASARVVSPWIRGTLAFIILPLLLVCRSLGQEIIPAEAFLNFEKTAKEEIAKALKREFAREMEEIEKLREPYRIGDRVSIKITRGGNLKTVTGRFNGIVASAYVKISSKKILLSDIDRNDRDRLAWNNDEKELAKIIKQRQQELAERWEKSKKRLRWETYKKEGYGVEFFERHVLLNDNICPRELLQDGRISAICTAAEKHELVQIRVRNPRDEKFYFVLRFGNLVIATNAEITDGKISDRAKDRNVTFDVSKLEMGEAFLDSAVEEMKLVCFQPDIGGWIMGVQPGFPRRAKVGKDGSTERAKLTFAIRKFRHKSGFVPLRTVDAGTFYKLADMAQSFQGQMEVLRKDIEIEEELRRETKAAEKKPGPDDNENQEDGSEPTEADVTDPDPPRMDDVPATGLAAILQRLKNPSLRYRWIPAARSGVRRRSEGDDRTYEPGGRWRHPGDDRTYEPGGSWRHPGDDEPVKKIMSNVRMDDPGQLGRLKRERVTFFTKWKPIDTARRKLGRSKLAMSFPEYRLILTQTEAKKIKCYLQYTGSFVNFNGYASKYSFQCRVRAGAETKEWTNGTDVAAHWSGKIYMANLIDTGLAAKPIASIVVNVTEVR